jgi:hypothetical protein
MPFTLTATASSGLPVSFKSTTPSICAVSGLTATLLTSGTCTVAASQPGDGKNYEAAPNVFQTFTVLAPQSITFNPIPNQVQGTPFTLTATASSGLPVSYASLTTGTCTVLGNTATLLAAGTCTMQASQAGNGTYVAATPVSQSFSVQSGQTITFNAISSQVQGTPFTLTATASSGLPVSYASLTTGTCTVLGNTATLLAAGTCTMQASQAGNGTYVAATPVSQSFSVQSGQTITFNAISSQVQGTPFTLTATASSGLPVSYASLTTGTCTVSGNTATLLAAGTCTMQASQAGNGAYAAATPVSQSFTVNPQSQTITFNAIPAQTVGTPLTLSAAATSGLAVSFASTTPSICTVSGSTATLLIAGTCTIQASQAGNGTTYAAATPVSQSFTVNLKPQTITFGAIPAQKVGTPLTLSATATSGLAVSFASTTPSICTVSGTTATLIAGGACTIQTSQPGNGTIWAAATPVSQSFTVNLKTQTIAFNTIPSQVQGKPLTLSASASSGLAVSFASSTPTICTVSGSTATMVSAGTCTIVASQAGNTVYAAATPVSQSFTVVAAFTITPLPPSETAFIGDIAAFALELRSTTGFTGNITLSCSGGPAGSHCQDFPQTVRLFDGFGLAISGILFPENTAPGTYTITFTGVSGAITNTATATFTMKSH